MLSSRLAAFLEWFTARRLSKKRMLAAVLSVSQFRRPLRSIRCDSGLKCAQSFPGSSLQKKVRIMVK